MFASITLNVVFAVCIIGLLIENRKIHLDLERISSKALTAIRAAAGSVVHESEELRGKIIRLYENELLKAYRSASDVIEDIYELLSR